MGPDEWASEYEKNLAYLREMASRLHKEDRRAVWRKQLVPGTVPARSADELIERMGFEVKP